MAKGSQKDYEKNRQDTMKMNNIKQIIIGMENLTDEEQIKLWMNLWHFADKELPHMRELFIWVKTKEQPDIKDIVRGGIK